MIPLEFPLEELLAGTLLTPRVTPTQSPRRIKMILSPHICFQLGQINIQLRELESQQQVLLRFDVPWVMLELRRKVSIRSEVRGERWVNK